MCSSDLVKFHVSSLSGLADFPCEAETVPQFVSIVITTGFHCLRFCFDSLICNLYLGKFYIVHYGCNIIFKNVRVSGLISLAYFSVIPK